MSFLFLGKKGDGEKMNAYDEQLTTYREAAADAVKLLEERDRLDTVIGSTKAAIDRTEVEIARAQDRLGEAQAAAMLEGEAVSGLLIGGDVDLEGEDAKKLMAAAVQAGKKPLQQMQGAMQQLEGLKVTLVALERRLRATEGPLTEQLCILRAVQGEYSAMRWASFREDLEMAAAGFSRVLVCGIALAHSLGLRYVGENLRAIKVADPSNPSGNTLISVDYKTDFISDSTHPMGKRLVQVPSWAGDEEATRIVQAHDDLNQVTGRLERLVNKFKGS
jgi:hypothetical protein